MATPTSTAAATKIKAFTDLVGWREAHALALVIYRLTRKFPKDEMFGLVMQMRRAAVSITSNIAEGFSRISYNEKIHFYAIALGSLTELQSQLWIARDVEYMSKADFDDTLFQSVRVNKLLNGLIKASRSFLIPDS